MATARWFYDDLPDSGFVISEHLRQNFWRVGPSAMWLDVVQSTAPYLARGYWREARFDLEWVPRQYVILRTTAEAKELERATALQLGFKATGRSEAEGKQVIEWRLTPAAQEALEPMVDAGPAV